MNLPPTQFLTGSLEDDLKLAFILARMVKPSAQYPRGWDMSFLEHLQHLLDEGKELTAENYARLYRLLDKLSHEPFAHTPINEFMAKLDIRKIPELPDSPKPQRPITPEGVGKSAYLAQDGTRMVFDRTLGHHREDKRWTAGGTKTRKRTEIPKAELPPKLPTLPRAVSPRIPEKLPPPPVQQGLKGSDIPQVIKQKVLSVIALPNGRYQMAECEEKNMVVVVNGVVTKTKSVVYTVVHNMFKCKQCNMVHNEQSPQQEVCSFCE